MHVHASLPAYAASVLCMYVSELNIVRGFELSLDALKFICARWQHFFFSNFTFWKIRRWLCDWERCVFRGAGNWTNASRMGTGRKKRQAQMASLSSLFDPESLRCFRTRKCADGLLGLLRAGEVLGKLTAASAMPPPQSGPALPAPKWGAPSQGQAYALTVKGRFSTVTIVKCDIYCFI